MANYCSDCGAELINGNKFCPACGKKVEQQPETQIQAQPQQQDEQLQTSMPTSKAPKSRKKLIIGILAVIVVVVIVLIFILYLLGGTSSFGGADSRFVGEWEQNTIDSPVLWKFNSDSTLTKESSGGMMNSVGTWKVNNTQFCLYNDTVCYTYQFSNNGNTLTLNISGESDSHPMNIVLTKKGQQGTDKTPKIECTIDPITNRVTIAFIDINAKWSDIAITTNPNATWQVQDANKNQLAKIGITATIVRYVTVGDNILILGTVGDVTVTLKYVPTNTLLGNWTVNV
jgi:zinc-ribbon domain